ncbi:MAG: P1 family peptidase [Acidimicrobiales bacterium]
MLTDIAGVKVGHWTDAEARTGCTVVILPAGSTASGEVRGGAPATREFALLDPGHLVSQVDAVVLSGGSAFGLAAGDGVVQWLADEGRGFETKAARVPIVVGMSLYDLAVGDAAVRPGAADGHAAAVAAATGPHAVGRVGAGAGATVAKWWGPDATVDGGLGVATVTAPGAVEGTVVTVSALIAVNAVGRPVDIGFDDTVDPGPPVRVPLGADDDLRANTTIGVIVTDAVADAGLCQLLAQSGHDGFARALFPAHTQADGDALVAAATGQVEVDPFHLRVLAQQAVTAAIRTLI